MGINWSQVSQFFPPTPHFTEKDLPSLSGKVFFITGGYSGVGLELARFLYRNRGRVYIAGRCEEKGLAAINNITAGRGPQSAEEDVGGTIEFIYLDLSDLRTVKPAVQALKAKESRLDALFNNAAVAQPPKGSLSAQGHDLQMATNCFGPFLLTQMLLSTLRGTAAACKFGENASVRVVWLSSQAVDLSAPTNGFSVQADMGSKTFLDPPDGYVLSKLGNWYLSSEFSRRPEGKGVINVTVNPGTGNTNLFHHTPWLPWVLWPIMHKPEMLANTLLYAGLSGEIDESKNGCYVIPWGRINEEPRRDLLDAIKPRAEGGLGKAGEFYEYCATVTQDYN